MTFNPYHQWLGLNPKIKNPHHFQLLGVSSKVDDPAKFKQQVIAAAKQKLDLLAQVPPGTNEQLVEQVKKKILFAQSILSDDKKRAEYVAKLKAQIKAAHAKPKSPAQTGKLKEAETVKQPSDTASPPGSPKQATVPTNSDPAPSPARADLLPPGVSASAPTQPASPQPVAIEQPPVVPQAVASSSPDVNQSVPCDSPAPVSTDAPEINTPAVVPTTDPSQSNPPVVAPANAAPAPHNVDPAVMPTPLVTDPAAQPAIPMAVPLSSGSAPVAAATPAAPTAPSAVAVNADGVPIDEVKISKVKRKRKKSVAGPIVLILMLLAGTAGAVSIYLNWERVLQLGGIDPDEVPSAPGIVKDDPENEPGNSASEDGNTDDPNKTNVDDSESTELAKVDIDNLPELDLEKMNSDAGDNDDPDGDMEDASNPNDDPSDNNVGDDPSKVAPDPADSGKTALKLEANQLSEIRKRMERVRRSLVRRDKPTATYELEKTDELFESILGSEFVVDPEQESIKQLVDATHEAMDYLTGFWQQVIKSCNGIAGGQEIVIGEQVVGFVEANQNEVIIRNAGSNIAYAYEYLPPGLAMKLAEKGAIEDIPTWRLQQAAFYALYADQNPTYGKKVDGLVEASESDGHDGTSLRRFLAFDLDAAQSDAKVTMPGDQAMKDALAEFQEQHDYSDPDKVEWSRAAEIAAILLDDTPKEIKTKLAYLDQARELAIRGRDAYLVQDALMEIDKLADLNSADWMADAFNQLAKQKLDSQQARRLMETAIPFLNSEQSEDANSRRKQMLIERLTKMAEKEGFIDSFRRLSQLD